MTIERTASVIIAIHHLSEKIPNYHLEACHHENIHLLSRVKTLRSSDMLACSKFILWDSDSNSLVSIASFRQVVQSNPLETEQNFLDKTKMEKALIKNVEAKSG